MAKTTWQDIYNLNNPPKGPVGNNPNLIYPDQVLTLPDGYTYTVVSGDNLSSIASRYNAGTLNKNQEEEVPAEPGPQEQATEEQPVTEAEEQTLSIAAQRQQALADINKQVNASDWRVRLRLAPQATYLYNDPDGPGIMGPLALTSGVVFPYTPKIETNYKANYTEYALTHSNYKNYFYQSSSVEPVTLSCPFTAQDTSEANYLLAVIHFFRACTKMFYGQDSLRGAPPPLVYLTGLGQYQFNEHPCVVTNFHYTLPDNVDYIRANSRNMNGNDLLQKRDRQTVPKSALGRALERLRQLKASQGINKGAQHSPPPAPTFGYNDPTYVPTRMDISLSLLPVQSRSQVSKQFSLKDYSNGHLLEGGFW